VKLHFTRPFPNTWRAGDYQIERWLAHDCCGHHRQYAATCAGEPLHPEPLGTLAEAKRRCAQHHEWRTAKEAPGH